MDSKNLIHHELLVIVLFYYDLVLATLSSYRKDKFYPVAGIAKVSVEFFFLSFWKMGQVLELQVS